MSKEEWNIIFDGKDADKYHKQTTQQIDKLIQLMARQAEKSEEEQKQIANLSQSIAQLSVQLNRLETQLCETEEDNEEDLSKMILQLEDKVNQLAQKHAEKSTEVTEKLGQQIESQLSMNRQLEDLQKNHIDSNEIKSFSNDLFSISNELKLIKNSQTALMKSLRLIHLNQETVLQAINKNVKLKEENDIKNELQTPDPMFPYLWKDPFASLRNRNWALRSNHPSKFLAEHTNTTSSTQ